MTKGKNNKIANFSETAYRQSFSGIPFLEKDVPDDGSPQL